MVKKCAIIHRFYCSCWFIWQSSVHDDAEREPDHDQPSVAIEENSLHQQPPSKQQQPRTTFRVIRIWCIAQFTSDNGSLGSVKCWFTRLTKFVEQRWYLGYFASFVVYLHTTRCIMWALCCPRTCWFCNVCLHKWTCGHCAVFFWQRPQRGRSPTLSRIWWVSSPFPF